MRTYIVYVRGIEVGTIKAGSHCAAEKKAIKKYSMPQNACEVDGRAKPNQVSPSDISVCYTEI